MTVNSKILSVYLACSYIRLYILPTATIVFSALISLNIWLNKNKKKENISTFFKLNKTTVAIVESNN